MKTLVEIPDLNRLHRQARECLDVILEKWRPSGDEIDLPTNTHLYAVPKVGRLAPDSVFLVKRGKIHGFLRAIWAKRILEWCPDPREAFEIAAGLNNKYALDGRSPSSFSGIAWAIGGKHDQPVVAERKIFGLVRYINVDKLANKFNIEAYISRVEWL